MKYIIFRFVSSEGIIGKIIRIVTWSKWTHVDIVLDEKTLFGASGHKGGVKKYAFDKEYPYTLVSLPVEDHKYEKFMEFILKQEGKKYDYRGIRAFLWIYRNRKQDIEKWFCSELLVQGMVTAKILKEYIIPETWSPDHLWKALSLCGDCKVTSYD